jgi:hypothetical protein
MAKVKIKNDGQAFELLQKLLDDPNFATPDVEFENWPRFEMHVKGDRYHSTITPELMESFLDLQKTINKSFALVRYSASSRKLKDSDREDLKILVRVADGSSGFFAALEEQVKTIAEGIAEGFKTMESRHKLIAILAIGTLAIGGYSFNSYVEHQKELRIVELKNIDHEAERAERIHTLTLYKDMSADQSDKVSAAYEKVFSAMPQIQTISEHMAGTYGKIVAGTTDADHITVQGHKVPGAVVHEISKTPRNVAVDDRTASVYRIRGVDHSSKEDYKFKLYDVIKKVEVQATLPKDGTIVTDQLLDVIQGAEWGGKVVLLQLRTKTRSGKVVKAEIEKVTEITNQDGYSDKVAVKAP